ncbi:MAG TPA: DUF3991 domain-containing protein [Clostridium sp.]|uniref:DUF3991 domain-containing protein n=1 Tax=Clostridium sp. TaxID=1506 RepID=UPI002F941F02
MALISQEEIQELKRLDLKSFIEDVKGFNFKQHGKNYYRCIEHTSLVIKNQNGIYKYHWVNEGQCGDIIEFTKNNITKDNSSRGFRVAVDYLQNGKFSYSDTAIKNKREVTEKVGKGEILIAYSDNMKRSYAYLSKTRGISTKIINELIKKELIAEDDSHNLIFKNYNSEGILVGGERIGTCSYIKYKGTINNSDEKYGFTLKLGNRINTLYVFEATIDLFSFYQIMYGKLDNALLLSIGGVGRYKKIGVYLNQFTGINVIKVCTDNDDCGTNCLVDITKTYFNYNVVDDRKLLVDNNCKDFNELVLLK